MRSIALAPSAAGWRSCLRVARMTALGVALLGAALQAMATAQPPAGATASASAVPGARQASEIVVITIHGPIDRWTAFSVQRRLEQAAEGGAGAVVIDLNTPGGEVGAVLEICSLIKNSPIPNTVAWVNPDAYSGGAIIALACREIVVARNASMGDAIPIQPMGMAFGQSMAEEERQKILAPLLAEVVDSARSRGWDEKLVQGFLALDVELWLVEDNRTGDRIFINEREYRMLFDEAPPRTSPRIASGVMSEAEPDSQPAPPRRRSAPVDESADGFRPATEDVERRLGPDLARQIDERLSDAPSRRPVLTSEDRGQFTLIEYATDGRTALVVKTSEMLDWGFASEVITSDEQLKEFFGAQRMVRLDMTWSEKAARFLSLFPVQAVLIIVFLVALFVEMAAPGIGIPGGVAALALIMLIAPPLIVGAAAWWWVGAVLVGLLLVGVEMFLLPGFGIPGVAGVVLLFAGLVGLVVGAGTGYGPGSSQEILWAIATVFLGFFTAGIALYFVSKYYGALPVFSRLVLTDEPRDADRDENSGMLTAMGAADQGVVEVGAAGVATTPLRPAGTVDFDGELVDVVSEFGFVERGQRVRVVQVTKYRVAVAPEAVEPPEPAGEEPA